MDNLNKGNISDVGLTGQPVTGTGKFSGDWNLDQQWWRDNFRNRPYVTADRSFEDYEPGYRFAYDEQIKYRGKNFNEIEPKLRVPDQVVPELVVERQPVRHAGGAAEPVQPSEPGHAQCSPARLAEPAPPRSIA